MSYLNKVLHIIPGFFPITKGGAEYFALNLCKGLKNYSIIPIIVTRGYKNIPKSEILDGLIIKRFQNILPSKIKKFGLGINLKSKFLRMLVAIFDVIGELLLIFKLYHKYRVNLVHASFIVPSGLIGVILKKILGIPVVITVHGPADYYTVPKFIRKFFSIILQNADKVITVSDRLRRDIKKEMNVRNILTIKNGIKNFDNRIKITDKISKYDIDKNIHEPILIMVGRLVKIKRIDLLIQSMPFLINKYPNIKLIILGEGIEKANLKQIIKKFRIEKNVIMPGWVSEHLKWRLLGISDIYVHLSKEEGLSLSLLESQFAGLPVIIPESEFAEEVIKNGYNGMVISAPLNVKKISENIDQLFSDKKLFNKMKANSKENSREFTLESMIKNYYLEYQKLLDKK
ncbi:MAG: glycosyltransferase family 4 protein [Promethearchaeota archaeon]|nr:MAG: glycosyltransferase family 4 protein [Candidatus Lokiarchaeota archaeon]